LLTVLALLGDLDDGVLLLLLTVGEDLDWLLELLTDGLLVSTIAGADHWDWADWAADLDAWVLLLQSQLGQLVLQAVQHLLDGSQRWLLDLLLAELLWDD